LQNHTKFLIFRETCNTPKPFEQCFPNEGQEFPSIVKRKAVTNPPSTERGGVEEGSIASQKPLSRSRPTSPL